MAMPEMIGRYKVARKIGRGGISDVFRAVAPDGGRVAVKFFRPFEALMELVGRDHLEELFVTEAETMSYLRHPAIAAIIDVGRDAEGRPFFVMEYFCTSLAMIIGEGIRPDLATRPLPAARVCDYGIQLLTGLAHIHDNGVVHRDIKPGNIMVDDDERLRICDFGLALVDELSFNGPEGVQIGSPFYVAPEQQSDPAGVDGRADLYSAGALLHRLLTGKVYAGGETSLPADLADNRGWREFFAGSLAAEPADRYPDAMAMASGLRALRAGAGAAGFHRTAEPAGGGGPPRREAVNVCGREALSVLRLDQLRRPLEYRRCEMIAGAEGTMIDQGTGLVWQEQASETAMTMAAALDYVERLNEAGFGQRREWRLPTVAELLTIITLAGQDGGGVRDKPREGWLWSCDRHGNRDSWYVNLEMGFVECQDNDCRNYVRAVSG